MNFLHRKSSYRVEEMVTDPKVGGLVADRQELVARRSLVIDAHASL